MNGLDFSSSRVSTRKENNSDFFTVPRWKKQRHLISSAFSKCAVENYLNVFNETSHALTRNLRKFANSNEEIDLWDHLSLTSFDALLGLFNVITYYNFVYKLWSAFEKTGRERFYCLIIVSRDEMKSDKNLSYSRRNDKFSFTRANEFIQGCLKIFPKRLNLIDATIKNEVILDEERSERITEDIGEFRFVRITAAALLRSRSK